jgi:hypothetical protein
MMIRYRVLGENGKETMKVIFFRGKFQNMG